MLLMVYCGPKEPSLRHAEEKESRFVPGKRQSQALSIRVRTKRASAGGESLGGDRIMPIYKKLNNSTRK